MAGFINETSWLENPAHIYLVYFGGVIKFKAIFYIRRKHISKTILIAIILQYNILIIVICVLLLSLLLLDESCHEDRDRRRSFADGPPRRSLEHEQLEREMV